MYYYYFLLQPWIPGHLPVEIDAVWLKFCPSTESNPGLKVGTLSEGLGYEGWRGMFEVQHGKVLVGSKFKSYTSSWPSNVLCFYMQTILYCTKLTFSFRPLCQIQTLFCLLRYQSFLMSAQHTGLMVLVLSQIKPSKLYLIFHGLISQIKRIINIKNVASLYVIFLL